MKKLFPLGMVAIALLFTACVKEEKLGTTNNPVKLYFTPSVDSDTITSNSTHFIQFLEKETGMAL